MIGLFYFQLLIILRFGIGMVPELWKCFWKTTPFLGPEMMCLFFITHRICKPIWNLSFLNNILSVNWVWKSTTFSRFLSIFSFQLILLWLKIYFHFKSFIVLFACKCTICSRCPKAAADSIRSLEAGITGGYLSPAGAGNKTQVLWKISKCSLYKRAIFPVQILLYCHCINSIQIIFSKTLSALTPLPSLFSFQTVER